MNKITNHISTEIRFLKNHLSKDLLHSGKYGMRVVRSKKGKGSYKRVKLDHKTF